jgi:hypothetical protein
MLEILILVAMTKSLAGSCRAKGRSTAWSALFPVLWVVGEITGFVVALSGHHGVRQDIDVGDYGYALLGAVVGGVLAFVIVKTLKAAPRDGDLPTARVV